MFTLNEAHIPFDQDQHHLPEVESIIGFPQGCPWELAMLVIAPPTSAVDGVSTELHRLAPVHILEAQDTEGQQQEEADCKPLFATLEVSETCHEVHHIFVLIRCGLLPLLHCSGCRFGLHCLGKQVHSLHPFESL